LLDRQAELARRAAELPQHEQAHRDAEAALQHFSQLQARRDAVAGQSRATGEEIAALKADLERTKSDGQAVNKKADVLNESGDGASCPLCAQALTPEHRDRMEADLRAEHGRLAEHYKSGNAQLKRLEEQRQAFEREDRSLGQELQGRDVQQRKAVAAEAGIADAQKAAGEQASMAEAINAVASRLSAEDYAHEARAAVAELSEQIAALGYDEAASKAAYAECQRLQPFDAEYQRQLLPALEGVDDVRENVGVLAAEVDRRIAEMAADQTEREALEKEVRDLAAREAELQQANGAVEAIAADERRARQQEGGAMQRLAALDALTERRGKLHGNLAEVRAEQGLYTELREAFGKKGIQAMIIESVIPEVETEANRLLNRMSEGRMSVRLETQREKVTGGTAEVLDIIISDELGSRPYETFSGGECFRANLALRIAISKLLAKRAGAQLQTLVIDEGFGSQDTTGRALVIEAINSIQDDFQRILVITHIDELKDLFPARIDVFKTPTGSRVSIA
jgi:DNA repair protein SbcC/Rad50